jgi:hypothetical protein
MSILLDVLEELRTRFIMALGKPPDEIKSMMEERIGKGQSQGILVKWAPQRAVLSHPVSFRPLRGKPENDVCVLTLVYRHVLDTRRKQFCHGEHLISSSDG